MTSEQAETTPPLMALLDSVQNLTIEVEKSRRESASMQRSITDSESTIKRLKQAFVFSIVGIAISFSGLIATYLVFSAASKNVCESRNEASMRARAYQDQFLTILVPDINAVSPENRERVQGQLDAAHAAIDETYIQRDCSVPVYRLNR